MRIGNACAAALIFGSLICASVPLAAGQEARTFGALPAAMRGAWGWSAESCADTRDDGRVVVAATSVTFFASAYALRRIVLAQDGAVRADAVTREEGEPGRGRASIALRLLGRDRISITTDASGHHDYVRCAAR